MPDKLRAPELDAKLAAELKASTPVKNKAPDTSALTAALDSDDHAGGCKGAVQRQHHL